jgi:hypothetical protein
MELEVVFGIPLQLVAKNGILMPHVQQLYTLHQLTEKD